MPTATDVDNRPVAIGKWPRLRRTGHAYPIALRRQQPQQQQHKDWCTLENCVQSCDESSNIHVLLHPELLYEFYGDRSLTSSNPLLEFCLDGGISRKETSPSEKPDDLTKVTSLLSQCSTCSDWLNSDSMVVDTVNLHLRQTGCDIDVQDVQGKTALHHLIQGCSKENFSLILTCIELLLDHQPDLNLTESQDQDSVFSCFRYFLPSNLAGATASESLVPLISKFLDQSPNVNHINAHQRTLLTYTVAQGDTRLDLTRMLLNNGSLVVPAHSQRWRDRSAFTWLVRSVMTSQDLRGHHETLLLLCQNMVDIMGPEAMREHVLSTFLHLGRNANLHGPLIMDLKARVAAFWKQPLPLLSLCRKTIRQSLGPKNTSSRTARLHLPPSLTQYLHYNHF